MSLIYPFETIRNFLETGGLVLWAILGVCILLWSLITERYVYFYKSYPRYADQLVSAWRSRQDTTSWPALRIREAILSRSKQQLSRNIMLINTIVAATPMLGLLGTVTGMIAVFDVMAMIGTSNARMMASGIGMATIPTMAGMTVAISGLFFSSRLKHRAEQEVEKLSEALDFEREGQTCA